MNFLILTANAVYTFNYTWPIEPTRKTGQEGKRKINMQEKERVKNMQELYKREEENASCFLILVIFKSTCTLGGTMNKCA